MLARSNLRLGWIACTTAGFVCLLAAGGRTSAGMWMAGLLTAGLVLEIIGSRAGALFNVGAWLLVPMNWMWERAHDANFSAHPGEYSLTLAAFVLPALAIAAVNLFFYVSALRTGRRAGA